MEDKSSKQIFDFFVSTDRNRNNLVETSKKGRQFSVSELTVLSCLDIISRKQENSLESYDCNKIIKLLLVGSAKDSIKLLNNTGKMESLVDEYEKRETDESIIASGTYNRIKNSFYLYEKPVYVDEKFISENLKLQETIRKGHIYWGAKGERLESILEHIYGCCMLAIAVENEYNYSINHDRLLDMLLVHELGEIVIGDLTEWDISKEEKAIIERNAVKELLSIFNNDDYIMGLYDEFESRITIVSEFARTIDKLQYDLEVKINEMNGAYDFNNFPKNVVTESDSVQEIIRKGAKSVYEVHYEYDKGKYSTIPCMRRILNESKKY